MFLREIECWLLFSSHGYTLVRSLHFEVRRWFRNLLHTKQSSFSIICLFQAEFACNFWKFNCTKPRSLCLWGNCPQVIVPPSCPAASPPTTLGCMSLSQLDSQVEASRIHNSHRLWKDPSPSHHQLGAIAQTFGVPAAAAHHHVRKPSQDKTLPLA